MDSSNNNVVDSSAVAVTVATTTTTATTLDKNDEHVVAREKLEVARRSVTVADRHLKRALSDVKHWKRILKNSKLQCEQAQLTLQKAAGGIAEITADEEGTGSSSNDYDTNDQRKQRAASTASAASAVVAVETTTNDTTNDTSNIITTVAVSRTATRKRKKPTWRTVPLTQDMLKMPIKEVYALLDKKRDSQHDAGWLRRAEALASGEIIVGSDKAGKNDKKKHFTLNEKQKMMHLRRYLNGATGSLEAPTIALAHAWGASERTIRYLDTKGIDLQRKVRSDAGSTKKK